MNNRIISIGRLKTLFGIGDGQIAASYNTLCPTKSQINQYKTVLGLVGQITNPLNYVDNQLIREGDVIRWTTTPTFTKIPASGGSTSLSNSPKIRCYFTENQVTETTYPDTTYGAWSVSNASAGSLGTTVKAETNIGTSSVSFTASPSYGGWTVTYSVNVYQQLNQLISFTESSGLSYPIISHSRHGTYFSSAPEGYNVDALSPTSNTMNVDSVKFSSGSSVSITVNNWNTYFSKYQIYSTKGYNSSIETNGKTINYNTNHATYGQNIVNQFEYTTNQSSWSYITMYNTDVPLINTQISDGTARTFTITRTPRKNGSTDVLKSKITVNANYRANGQSYELIQFTTTKSHSFTQYGTGTITFHTGSNGLEYIMLDANHSSLSDIPIYYNSQMGSQGYSFNSYGSVSSTSKTFGVIIKGDSSSINTSVTFLQSEYMPISISVAQNIWSPQYTYTSFTGTIEIIPLDGGSGNQRIAHPLPGTGTNKITNWNARKDYVLTLA